MECDDTAEVDSLARCMVQLLASSRHEVKSIKDLVSRAAQAVPAESGLDHIELRQIELETRLVLSRLSTWYADNPWM